MKYKLNDRIQVINVNYDHKKRDQINHPKIIGLKGTVFRLSVTENAYSIKLDSGHIAYLYSDEIKLIDN